MRPSTDQPQPRPVVTGALVSIALALLALTASCDAVPVPPTGETSSASSTSEAAPVVVAGDPDEGATETPGGVLPTGATATEGTRGQEGRARPGRRTSSGANDRGAGERGASGLGEGLVVWESNRSGSWRVWSRSLDGGPPRQLTPDEPGRQHYAPHISPDGTRVAYLSARDGGRKYPEGGLVGSLRLIAVDGGNPREIVPAARTYFENRAAVWKSPTEIIYIGEDRRTRLLDLGSGESRLLTQEPGDRFGCLIDATLGHASSNSATFSVYEAGRRRILPRSNLGGCQPYFSHDGRWGVWTAGAGGPIKKMDLESRRSAEILDKNDPRLPEGLGYLYFPMPSRDGTLLALAGSRNEHDHFTGDYEIFVVETDPETLELIGTPRRFTEDPATDRYPDVFREPLALGTHRGEAPFELTLGAPGGGRWRWTSGSRPAGSGEDDGVEGPSFSHRYDRPGAYTVEARRGQTVLRARVVVAPGRPPQVVASRLSGDGRRVLVELDEPVEAERARVSFLSGRKIARWELDASGRTLRVDLAQRFDGTDELELSGLMDRAQEPHEMPVTRVDIGPLRWPAIEDGLVFSWQNGESANLVPVEGGAERAIELRPTGMARLDHYWAMLPGAGRFEAEAEDAARVKAALQSTNELTIELTLRGARGPRSSLVSASDARQLNFRLERRGATLTFQVRTGNRGPEAHPTIELFDLPAGGAHHVVVTYSPARLVAYLDGEKRLEVGAEAIRGDFFHWRNVPLSFGDGETGATSIEGVAIFDQALDAEQVDAEYRRYRQQTAGRPKVPVAVVEARLVVRTPAPSLEEISPYREALAVSEYEVVRVESGSLGAERIRVAHWAILDGRRLDGSAPARGSVVRLRLEPFEANPQLGSLYLGQAEGIRRELPLYYAPDPEAGAAREEGAGAG